MAPCLRANGSGAGPEAADRPSVVAIFRRHAEAYQAARPWLSPEQHRLLRDVMVCRTAALGGHLYVCDSCDHRVPVYNSCRNRGCPNCQALSQAKWIEARKARVLPVGHHHVVVTLPGQLRRLAMRHPRKLFNLLMVAVRETLTDLARDHLGIQLGVTAVLHTWTRELLFHPHVHCVVTAGGLTLDGTKWVDRKGFLLPVDLVKAHFRGRVLHHLDRLQRAGELGLGVAAFRKLVGSLPKPDKWCVHIEQPFGRSKHVFEYLGRYTHRIAISDFRLVSATDDAVTFRTHGNDTITLAANAFIDRYLKHVLPAGLHKIRHFGLYAAATVNKKLPVAAALLGDGDRDEPEAKPAETAVELMERLTGEDLLRCPKCREGRMKRHPLETESARGPPRRVA